MGKWVAYVVAVGLAWGVGHFVSSNNGRYVRWPLKSSKMMGALDSRSGALTLFVFGEGISKFARIDFVHAESSSADVLKTQWDE